MNSNGKRPRADEVGNGKNTRRKNDGGSSATNGSSTIAPPPFSASTPIIATPVIALQDLATDQAPTAHAPANITLPTVTQASHLIPVQPFVASPLSLSQNTVTAPSVFSWNPPPGYDANGNAVWYDNDDGEDYDLEVVLEADHPWLQKHDVREFWRPLREYSPNNDFCKFLVEKGYMYYDPLRRVVRPRPKQPQVPHSALTVSIDATGTAESHSGSQSNEPELAAVTNNLETPAYDFSNNFDFDLPGFTDFLSTDGGELFLSNVDESVVAMAPQNHSSVDELTPQPLIADIIPEYIPNISMDPPRPVHGPYLGATRAQSNADITQSGPRLENNLNVPASSTAAPRRHRAPAQPTGAPQQAVQVPRQVAPAVATRNKSGKPHIPDRCANPYVPGAASHASDDARAKALAINKAWPTQFKVPPNPRRGKRPIKRGQDPATQPARKRKRAAKEQAQSTERTQEQSNGNEDDQQNGPRPVKRIRRNSRRQKVPPVDNSGSGRQTPGGPSRNTSDSLPLFMRQQEGPENYITETIEEEMETWRRELSQNKRPHFLTPEEAFGPASH